MRRLLLILVVVAGCYSDPDLAPLLEPTPVATPTPTPARTQVRAEAPAAKVGQWITDLKAAGERLRTDEPSAPRRPGADGWRAPELDKVGELLTTCCQTTASACRRCLDPIAAAELPADEVWPLMRLFLTELKPQAELGAALLAGPAMLRAPASTRDRLYRLAVGSGGARRGQPDATSRRVAWVPLAPRTGEPLVLIGELSAPCPELRSSIKGPDDQGRIDLDFTFDCPPLPELAEGELREPKASRAVGAWPVAAMPEGGLEVWLPDAESPIRIRPASGPAPLSSGGKNSQAKPQ